MPTETQRDTTEAALSDALEQIGSADIVAGIPSYDNAATIGHVIASVRDGLRGSFPDARSAIVNSDGGSGDGTTEVARRYDEPELRVVSLRYAGPSGKGSALRAVFAAVRRLGARAGCVLDSDLRSVTPAWVERLLRPIADGRADYVTPLYSRHKHDGTITNTVVYPLVRAAFGQRVRQPIGGEFGFSAALAGAFQDQDVWETDVARFGIDVFMTSTALARGARVAQAALGAKVHDPKDPAAHLGPMFSQVVGSTLRQLDRYRASWRGVSGSRPLPVEGDMPDVELEPVRVDLDALDARYAAAATAERERADAILCGDDRRLFDAYARERRPADASLARAWARIVYDVAGASLRDGGQTDANVRALLPLYFARVAMHVRAASGMMTAEAEALVEAQAEAFEAEKSHLLEHLAA